MKLARRRRVTVVTIRRWADLSRKPADRYKQSIEDLCVRFAEGVLKDAGVPVPDHKANVIAAYTSLAPAIRSEAGVVLQSFVDDFSQRAAAVELNINRRTVKSWIDHPERIPVEKAVSIYKKGVES
jgi:DNA-directed RNA polymerase specialized sigma24 family protein